MANLSRAWSALGKQRWDGRMKKYVRSVVSTAPQGRKTRIYNPTSISDLHTQPNISDQEHTQFKAGATQNSPLNTLISGCET